MLKIFRGCIKLQKARPQHSTGHPVPAVRQLPRGVPKAGAVRCCGRRPVVAGPNEMSALRHQSPGPKRPLTPDQHHKGTCCTAGPHALSDGPSDIKATLRR